MLVTPVLVGEVLLPLAGSSSVGGEFRSAASRDAGSRVEASEARESLGSGRLPLELLPMLLPVFPVLPLGGEPLGMLLLGVLPLAALLSLERASRPGTFLSLAVRSGMFLSEIFSGDLVSTLVVTALPEAVSAALLGGVAVAVPEEFAFAFAFVVAPVGA
ncbi:MAG: hypothetical protein ACKOUR_00815, partial [Planctomycetota bacterium]